MMHVHKRLNRLVAMGLGIGLAAASFVSTASASAPSPAFIPPTADWLTTVNYFRAMAGLGSVVEDGSMSAGAAAHSCYMLYNGISHDETPGLQGYTPEGDVAGNSGNVAVSSLINTSARSHVELWMSGPFHAIGILRPNLHSTGFGRCDLASTPTWHSGATLDVLRGLGNDPRPANPILFPGNGTTTNLDRFVVESPSPMTFCGWTGSAGLPDHRHDARGRQQRNRLAGRTRMASRSTCASSRPPTPAVSPSRSCRVTTPLSSCPAPSSPKAPTPSPPAHRHAMSTGASRSIPPPRPVAPGSQSLNRAAAPATGLAPLAPARIVDTRISRRRHARLPAGTSHTSRSPAKAAFPPMPRLCWPTSP